MPDTREFVPFRISPDDEMVPADFGFAPNLFVTNTEDGGCLRAMTADCAKCANAYTCPESICL